MYLSVVYGSTCTSETPSGAIVTLACLVKGLCAVVFKMVPLLLFYAKSSASFFCTLHTDGGSIPAAAHFFFISVFPRIWCLEALSSQHKSAPKVLSLYNLAQQAIEDTNCLGGR